MPQCFSRALEQLHIPLAYTFDRFTKSMQTLCDSHLKLMFAFQTLSLCPSPSLSLSLSVGIDVCACLKKEKQLNRRIKQTIALITKANPAFSSSLPFFFLFFLLFAFIPPPFHFNLLFPQNFYFSSLRSRKLFFLSLSLLRFLYSSLYLNFSCLFFTLLLNLLFSLISSHSSFISITILLCTYIQCT